MELQRHLISRAGQQPAERAGCGQFMRECHALAAASGDEDVRVGGWFVRSAPTFLLRP